MDRTPLILIAGETLGLGGAEKVTVDLANVLHESGVFRVHVTASLTTGGLFADDLMDGIPVSAVCSPQRLVELCGKLRPDGILLNNCSMATTCIDEILAAHAPAWLGFFLHGDSKYSMDLLPDAMPEMAEVLTISNEAKTGILRQRPDIGRSAVGVLENCVDTKRFHPRDAGEEPAVSVWAKPHGPVFGYAGRFSGEKALVTMVDVFRRTKAKLPDAKLLLVGGADPAVSMRVQSWTAEQQVIEQVIRQMGLTDSVHITGLVPNPEDYYRMMDVFLLTSHFEGLPLVLLEAMACGLPVVSTAVGAVPRLLKHGAGIAVEREGLDLNESEREFFADRMVEIATSSRRSEMGLVARRTVTHFHSEGQYRRAALEYFAKRITAKGTGRLPYRDDPPDVRLVSAAAFG